MVQEGTALYSMRQHEKSRRLRILSLRNSHDKTMNGARVNRSLVWWRCPGLNGGPAAYENESGQNTKQLHATAYNGRCKPIKGFVACRCSFYPPVSSPHRDSFRTATVTETGKVFSVYPGGNTPSLALSAGGGGLWGPRRLARHAPRQDAMPRYQKGVAGDGGWEI